MDREWIESIAKSNRSSLLQNQVIPARNQELERDQGTPELICIKRKFGNGLPAGTSTQIPGAIFCGVKYFTPQKEAEAHNILLNKK